jgi:hypothetical protein
VVVGITVVVAAVVVGTVVVVVVGAVVVDATVVVAEVVVEDVDAGGAVVEAVVVDAGGTVVAVAWAAAATWAANPMSGAGGAGSRIRNHQVPTASTTAVATNRFLRIGSLLTAGPRWHRLDLSLRSPPARQRTPRGLPVWFRHEVRDLL